MQTVKIQTSQNVDIDYEMAGLGDRALAVLLDYLILVGYVIGVFSIMGYADKLFRNAPEEWLGLFLTLAYLPVFLYDLLFEIFMNGQSIGKKALKIKVVKLDGSQPTLGSYLLRWILRPVDFALSFGTVAIITFLVTGKGQRVGDIAAGTTVVKIKPPVTLEDTILTEVEENYSPFFAEVKLLNDQDIATVKEVMNAEVQQSKFANHLTYKTKTVLESKMGIKSDMLPGHFLEIILKDYNYYKGQSA